MLITTKYASFMVMKVGLRKTVFRFWLIIKSRNPAKFQGFRDCETGQNFGISGLTLLAENLIKECRFVT